MKALCSILMLVALSPVLAADAQPALERTPVEAVTGRGDKVVLHPNGRWEYVDAKKAEMAKKVAEQYPENRTRPVDAQGGLIAGGRLIMPGEADYNRGSLNPKLR